MKFIVAILVILSMNVFLCFAVQPVNKPTMEVSAQKGGKIVVTVKGLRNDKGNALVCLYASKEGFLNNPKKAYKVLKGKISNGKAQVVFKNIPSGIYAISVIHDEDADLELDRNFIMAPIEGYGTSKNVYGIFGTPSFDDARFEFDSGAEKPVITIRY